jgi:type III secretion protein L
VNQKIIKHGAAMEAPASALAAKIVRREAYDATVEAEQIVEAARAQAREILEDAGQARQAVLESARSEGYAQGLLEWNAAVAGVHAARERYFAESEPELIRLAVRIAQKIVAEELRANPQAIVSIARECLKGIRRERFLTLRVAPVDAGFVRSSIGLLREESGHDRSIEVVADAAISSGGCIVESEYGVIDARLETQIRCLEEALLRAARK